MKLKIALTVDPEIAVPPVHYGGIERIVDFFHYVCNKDKPIFSFPNWRDIPDTFYINETGFYKSKASAYFLRLFKKYPILFLYYLRKLPKWIYKKLSRG